MSKGSQIRGYHPLVSIRSFLAVSFLLLSSCLTTKGQSATCVDCHGTPETGPAPPKALGGETDPSFIGVGSHQAHALGTKLGSPVACVECHVVPTALWSEGHIDTSWPAEVVWGPITKTGTDRIVVWDRETQTCGNTYCHSGADADTLGAAFPNPVWNSTDPEVTACSGCHGWPPPTPTHQPDAENCNACHAPTVDENQALDDRSVHMDGEVTGGCTSKCHDLPTEDNFHDPPNNRCESCHTAVGELMTIADSSLHTNGVFDGDCAGACHTMRPTTVSHPDDDRCEACHSEVAGPNFTIVDWSLHANGVTEIDNNVACEVCHGDTDSAAPPPDADGAVDTNLMSVGAHETHDDGGPVSGPVACDACHPVPGNGAWAVKGHIDDEAGEVTFGGLAVHDGNSPTWDGGNGTCSNTFCHGASSSGGTNTTPVWNVVDGTQAACGTCHGNPPDAPHPNFPGAENCENCHGSVAGPGMTIIDTARHIDGTTDF